ncbi:tetratricopeptide repeat protein, partial [Candidatus Poribacteria bacterium]|nr:tetratricopeptide repeat protein [Candidatus Poribacteria bacterium]
MTRLVLITCVLPIFAQYIHAATETETALANVRSALQGKQFTDALVQIDAALATADEGRDYLLYLKGLALFYNKDFTAASQVCDQFLTAHPNSEWLRKATFLQAQCYLNLKEFERAEAIYNAEVNRLLSSGRKTEIAQVYIRFAESVSRLPDKNDLDSPPPNHQKAYNLYQKALGLEIDAELRAEIMYRLGRMMQLAGNYPQAIRDYQTYLAEFDPRPNLSPDPSPERRGGKAETGRDVSPFPLREGGQGVRSDAHRYEARYHLVACQIAIDQHQLARINLEELLKRLEASPPSEAELQNLSRDARFLLTRTYHFPAPQTDEELELGAQAAKRFMTDFPGDSRSMSLAYEIAQAFQGRGRSEDALRAFQDFLAGKGFTLPTGAQLNAPTKDETGESFAERHSRLRMSATFEVGQIRFDQQNYAGAIESWKGYISAFPNGPQWTDAQQRIIDAEFQIGVTYLTEEKYEDAVRAFDAFQAAHPLDDRVRQILLIYGQIHVHKAETLEKEGGQTDTTHYQQAIAEWEKLVSKYPNTEESSLALFRIAEVYEVKLGELEKALESYRKLTWGSWQEQAQFRIRQMTEKQLKLVTQRTFRTNEGAKVQVNVRNIEALTVNLYKVNL